MQGIDELAAVADGGDSSAGGCNLAEMAQLLRVFDSLPSHQGLFTIHCDQCFSRLLHCLQSE